jgi:hypothetical protein
VSSSSAFIHVFLNFKKNSNNWISKNDVRNQRIFLLFFLHFSTCYYIDTIDCINFHPLLCRLENYKLSTHHICWLSHTYISSCCSYHPGCWFHRKKRFFSIFSSNLIAAIANFPCYDLQEVDMSGLHGGLNLTRQSSSSKLNFLTLTLWLWTCVRGSSAFAAHMLSANVIHYVYKLEVCSFLNYVSDFLLCFGGMFLSKLCFWLFVFACFVGFYAFSAYSMHVGLSKLHLYFVIKLLCFFFFFA